MQMEMDKEAVSFNKPQPGLLGANRGRRPTPGAAAAEWAAESWRRSRTRAAGAFWPFWPFWRSLPQHAQFAVLFQWPLPAGVERSLQQSTANHQTALPPRNVIVPSTSSSPSLPPAFQVPLPIVHLSDSASATEAATAHHKMLQITFNAFSCSSSSSPTHPRCLLQQSLAKPQYYYQY
ncbi:hypothetical protein PWT90_08291 [Aphanocladium album]|nr:hypothetical protein PWT90_08291 [Aphanocladium album]